MSPIRPLSLSTFVGFFALAPLAYAEDVAAPARSVGGNAPVTAEQNSPARSVGGNAPVTAEQHAPQVASPAKKATYSLPWGLRPAVAGTVLRLDNAFAVQNKGSTIASMVLGSYKLAPDFALLARVPIVRDSTEGVRDRVMIANPIVAATYAPKLGGAFRAPLFLGITLPVGMGGGTESDGKSPASYRVAGTGVYARSAMDNALFAVNFSAVVVGAGLAYAKDGLTVHAEGTLLEIVRVRGKSIEKDAARTNMTLGLHLGYEFVPEFTLSAEVRYQRWLTNVAAISADSSKRDQFTAGLGFRTKVEAGKTAVVRPGIAYFHPIDDPMSKAGYHVIMLDFPVSY